MPTRLYVVVDHDHRLDEAAAKQYLYRLMNDNGFTTVVVATTSEWKELLNGPDAAILKEG